VAPHGSSTTCWNLARPADANYGVQTARALHNFQITGTPLSRFTNFVHTLAMVNKVSHFGHSSMGN
jgi:aspartate ammonia-lyase